MRRWNRAAVPLCACLMICFPDFATAEPGTFASPAGYDDKPGDSGQNSILRDASRTYQMIFDSSALPGLAIGEQITGLSWRSSAHPLANSPASWPLAGETCDFSYFSIWLAPAAHDAVMMSNTIADNIGAGEQLVRSGQFSIPSGSFLNNGEPGPNPWGMVFDFDTPFTYTGGPLVMTIRHPGMTGSDPLFFDAVDGGSADLGVRAVAALTDIHQVAPFTHSVITQFTVVPGPGSAGALCLGSLLFFPNRRR